LQVSVPDPAHHADVQDLARFGHPQELRRALGVYSSFAVAFSYISPSTGIFTLFILGIGLAGPAFIWSWPIVVVGQLLVGLNFAEVSSHFPVACHVLDDPHSVALGSEPVRIGGEVAGRVTSGGYGYTVGRSIAYAYVPASAAVGAPVEVEIFGSWVPGQVAKEPLYNPSGEKIRS
jgi:amino acid transporter